MPPRFRLPIPPSIFRETKRQLPGFVAGSVTHPMREEDLTALRDDISDTMTLRGTDAAAQIVPPGVLRDRIQALGDKHNVQQVVRGGLGAAGGGLLGAGAGALTMGLARGRKYAPLGLLSAIPGAVAGYGIGRDRATRSQLLEALSEELGPGAGIKKANVEPGFKEVLRHLYAYKVKDKLTMPEFSQAIRDLKVGRGRDLSPPERLIVRKVILGQKDLPKAIINVPKGRPAIDLPDLQFGSTVKNTTSKLPKPRTLSGSKALGIAAGTAAALSALGLGAALWPRDKDSVLRD